MKLERLELTNHAVDRWRERVCCRKGYEDKTGEDFLRDYVSKSSKLDKHDPLFYSLKKKPDSFYSCIDEIIFVLKPEGFGVFKLITIFVPEVFKIRALMKKKAKIPKLKHEEYDEKDKSFSLMKSKLKELDTYLQIREFHEDRR